MAGIQARRTPRAEAVLCAAIALTVSALSVPARADAPRSGDAESARSTAAASFEAGERAFAGGAYARAAELFEQAYDAAPHADAAWNAAQAWLRTEDAARAATWLALFLAAAAEGAPDRAEARAKLDELARRLGRVDVRANGVQDITLDGRPLREGFGYATPGPHRLEGSARGSALAAQRIYLAPGEAIHVTMGPPPARPDERPKERPQGLSPFVVIVGGAATAGLGVTTILFGAATERAHDEWARSPSQSAYDDGQRKQDLTNGFFWGTVAAGAVTTAIALFFVDWKRPLFAF